ncbi:MAG: TIGR02757 family protein [Deltaproteobacteria bacterium]|nr:TIGR02757 family protein [Deltaproteobacteria bacterium]
MDVARLRGALDRLAARYNASRLQHDPLSIVREYQGSPRDQEVVGLLAAVLAFGRAELIIRAVRDLLGRMDRAPYEFVLTFDPAGDAPRFAGWQYRLWKARDLACLLHLLRQLLEEHGSVGSFFQKAYAETGSVAGMLERFTAYMLSRDCSPFYRSGRLPARAPVRSFFPRPSDGSACKRLNLYLRWMARGGDTLDTALWPTIPAAALVMPLDTHVARISRYLGLTRRRSPGWRMADAITAALRRVAPEDPVRYDFALSHLGISGDCPRRLDLAKCRPCPLNSVCRRYRLASARTRRAAR